ncbi:MAG: C4-dicarboxylate ABC transporter [Nitrospirae bacterium RBG_16_64_22]|nr:MAG: C4-dicarboxylate ABC transporter [Nitrospirae bacterium RBG_16_64_22]
MTTGSPSAQALAEEIADYEHRRLLSGTAARIVFGVCMAFSAFQIYNAAFSPLSSLILRSVHVGFLLTLAFILYSVRRGSKSARVPWIDWGLAVSAFVLALYHWVFEADIIQRSGDPSAADLAVGAIVVVMVFEATRRVMGIALPLICAAFLAYGLFGQHLPGALAHRGYGFDQVVNQIFLGTEGIYGTPTLVSATYIFLFILFGSLLEQAGMIQLFNDVSLGAVGHHRGGPGKVSVISSGLMGTISGSGVANVVMGGHFTINLMKRFGYSAEFAGAVEATSSMGGQIMPPVMGAVAFIMAETIDVPYLEVAKAAAIPAVLYFATAYWIVHLEAGRAGLFGLRRDECPSALGAVRGQWPLLLPLAALIYLLMTGFTPLFASLAGLALTTVIILGRPLAERIGVQGLRVVFWVALGVIASALFSAGIQIVLGLIAALVIGNLFARGGRDTLRLMLSGLAEGATGAVSVGLACAIVGVIVAILTLTGLASGIASTIVALSGNSLFLGLVLTMVTSLVLGMGVPTIPNYIITSSVAAPALLQMGVPLLVSHMFVFYFGIMADLTPPVALAAFAAAAIAKTSPMRVGVRSLQIAVAGFVVPFIAVYSPALMLQGGSLFDTVYIVFKALVAVGLWGAATVGFLWHKLGWPERALAAVSACLLVVALPVTDEIGFALAGLFLAAHWRRSRHGTDPG